MNRYNVLDFGACNDGSRITTKEIQKAIDCAFETTGEVYIPEGTYLVSSLFLKSNTSLFLEENAVLLGTTDESEYPIIPTRVAGVEMDWYCGIINVNDAENVKICGNGTIDGQGEYWWNKYWGTDRKGGMRKIYEEKGLRWAVDYDCIRTRNVVVFNSRNITLSDFNSYRSGFWNVHICYSEKVSVSGLNIDKNQGPSTDGIDIDSCNDVFVEKCTINCNDDNICIKSGRDADGLRVNRICENIIIRDCTLYKGAGITLGSETSGGMRNIEISDIKFDGTGCGFRLKSAKTRGGVIENVSVKNLVMKNVRNAFSFQFDWNPSYSYCEMPSETDMEILKHWHILAEKVPVEKGTPYAKNITIEDVIATTYEDLGYKTTAFDIQGIEEAPFEDFIFSNINITAHNYGEMRNIKEFVFRNINVNIL